MTASHVTRGRCAPASSGHGGRRTRLLVAAVVAALGCSTRPREEPVIVRPPPVPVVLATDTGGIPAFPPLLYAAGAQGEVVVDLAVGPDGRVDSSATRVVTTAHALFTDAVRAVLPRWRVTSPTALDTARGPRRVRVEFTIGDSVGMPTFTRVAGGARGTPTRYVVGERPLRGTGRALASGPVADSVVAAVRAATHDAIVRSVLYFPRDGAATARWIGEKRPNKGGYSRDTGRCVVVRRAGAPGAWVARCQTGSTIEALYQH
ncbi:MAG TPA: energy transducer TonB [Gemmatimonadaceae bacterium]|nr:energy transducer TonB [Gemmatimonadaceae bacterium]